jgi:hypothetical protein
VPTTLTVPHVVDLGPERCPEVNRETRDEAHRTTSRPPFDTKDVDGTRAYSPDAVRQWISAHEVSETRKNLTLSRAIDHIERCRGVANAQS